MKNKVRTTVTNKSRKKSAPVTRTKGKSIIVVLGMHRSGTSVITRGLQTMGVDLGTHLMAPVAGNNEKGFFEDIDVNAINIELLESIGQSWHTLAFVPGSELLREEYASFQLRAIELLRSRFHNIDCFGLKDPSMCRLLPFWQKVFQHLKLEVSYVIAVRNPLSVAKSMEKRDHLPPEKSHYLWLEHVLPSVLLTEGTTRVLVDYDLLLQDPQNQLSRIARALGRTHKLDPILLDEFCQDFLDDHLRHTSFDADDVFEDPLVPSPVRTAFALLIDIAKGKRSLDSGTVAKTFRNLSEQMDGMAQAMDYLLRLDNIIALLNQAVHDKDVHIGNLEQMVSERDVLLAQRHDDIARFNQMVHDKDVHIGNLEQMVSERDVLLVQRHDDIARLSQMVHDKDVHIGNLEQMVSERDVLLAQLNQAVHDKDMHIGNLEQMVSERDVLLAQLDQAVHDKDVHIGNLDRSIVERNIQLAILAQAGIQKDQVIQQLHASTVQLAYRLERTRASIAWKFFRPLRALNGLWCRINHKQNIELAPLAQLQHSGSDWQSTGNTPQLLLIAERAWHGIAGWYWLVIEVFSEQTLNARLNFDIGAGFDPSLTISFMLEGKGTQRIPVYVPLQCQAIRFAPCDISATFKLSVREMNRLESSPELPEEFGTQSAVYEKLGGRTGNAASLVPVHDVSPSSDSKYYWHTEGADPWFVIEDFVHQLRPGWYMVELRIHTDVGHGNAKFYFDYGDGYSESSTLAMPFITGHTVKRLFRLERIPLQTRFDPLDCVAQFSVAHIHFAPVLPIFAHNRMLRRLKNTEAGYKDFALRHVWQDIKKCAANEGIPPDELLGRRYDETFVASTPNNTYAGWIAVFETPVFSNHSAINAARQNFKHLPTISVVMPTYNTDEVYLRKAIESVIGQSYPNWELCIADDASPKPHVRMVLEEYAQHDSRIKVTYRPENGHISAASNSALALATGDYVALLDHDDALAPHALHFVVEAINLNPSSKIIYSDEDKIDEKDNRSEPHFKSDWNPDMFFSQNYISHLGVYQRELLQHIGGFRAGVEGSQDQDLLLRCLPYVKPEEIVHIPKVLYHWRMLEGSTALDSGEKSYTTDAGIKALQEFFSAQGQDEVKVETGLVPNTYHVRYPIPQPEPLVSLLIPTRDMLVVLEPCIRSILDKTTYQNYEIIILDNESTEPATQDYFERIQSEDERVKIIPYHHPFNFSAINNYGVQLAKGSLIGLINNDIEVISPGWLTEMVSHALRPEIGCVGAKLYYDDETIQHAGVIIGLGGVAGHSHKYFPREAQGYFHRLKIVQNLSAVTAACLVIRKTVYEQVGGLEEKLRVAFNDVDFCIKVREAGYRNLWTPYAELYHHESKSRGAENTPEKVERFNSEVEFVKSKWGDILQHDPCYSPNLTLAREDFSIGE